MVVHEPTTMAKRMGAMIGTDEWAAFARDAARVVKAKSPRSRIGAGGLHTEREHFETFAAMREIEVLTMDVYNVRALDTFEAMTRTAQRHGKPVYIEETMASGPAPTACCAIWFASTARPPPAAARGLRRGGGASMV